MKNHERERDNTRIEALLEDPAVCALFLNDALETGEAAEIADALETLRRVHGSVLHSMPGVLNPQIAEILEVLGRSGIRLFAMPDAQHLRTRRTA